MQVATTQNQSFASQFDHSLQRRTPRAPICPSSQKNASEEALLGLWRPIYDTRHEPGKNLAATGLFAPGPHNHELICLPAAGGVQVANVEDTAAHGAILMVPPGTKAPATSLLSIPADVTVMTALPGAGVAATAEVEMEATNLDVATELSQPNPSTALGNEVPVWNTSVIEVRHDEPAKITSDILARTV